MALSLTSPAFEHGQPIPRRYSCEGLNDGKKPGCGGPCPPMGKHRYFFKLYALDRVLGNLDLPTKRALEKAMTGHLLGQAEFVGVYRKAAR